MSDPASPSPTAPRRPLPPLGPHRELKLPKPVERTLPNGLTVIAIRRSAVPLVELRLRIPFARANLARAALLTQTMFSGTSEYSTVRLAAELQKIGGALSATADPDRLLVSGNALVSGIDRLLELLAVVLADAEYPSGEVSTERARLADRIKVARSQPAHLAREALLKRVFGRHPYSTQTPTPAQVMAVGTAGLRGLHAERIHPEGATLVLVGDLNPSQVIDAAERALSGWKGGGKHSDLPAIPALIPGPITLVDRPGSVQSSLRVALPAVPRQHPDHAVLQLANLVFGGYFSSRWVENIREDKGYTYGPHSVIEHNVAGSSLTVAAEVATDVTAAALLETQYELGRISCLPPEDTEVDQARQYALGTLQLSAATQAGLAGLASTYAGFGLRLEYLAEHAGKLIKATTKDVAVAAAKYLAPAKAAVVVLGDAEKIYDSLALLGSVERTDGPQP